MLQVFRGSPQALREGLGDSRNTRLEPANRGGPGASANKADLLQPRTFYSREISLLPQFTHCKNQHNLSSGGKGADFSLVFFSFSFWFKQQLSLSHLKKKVGKGESRGPNCKFESKHQRGRSLKGWREACLRVTEWRERRFAHPCFVCPVSVGITDF